MDAYLSQNHDEQPEPEQLSDVSIHAGFPNPAADSDRRAVSLSLDQLLLSRPSSTYMFRLSGHSWSGEGIAAGDIAVVDRAILPKPRDLVVTWLGDEFTLTRRSNLPLVHTPWGTVTAIVHMYKGEA